MLKKFLNEIENEEKNVNEQLFKRIFNYYSPSFSVKDLYKDNKNKNDKILKNVNESWS